MSSDIKAKWDRIYQSKSELPTPAEVLAQNKHLLPVQGNALDLACGQGGNALLLAQHGLDVAAWDISDVAIEQLKAIVIEQGLSIDAQQRDVMLAPPEVNQFDVIVVSFFLDRSLCDALKSALKPGGVLFYQTYCSNKVSLVGPSNPRYLLDDNELLMLFSGMKVRLYHEEALLGNLEQGFRNQAYLIAEKTL